MTAEAVSAAAQPGPAGPLSGCTAPDAASAAGTPAAASAHLREKDAHPMRDDPVVTDLVTTARNGDKQAWDALVERYAPLVWSICRRHLWGSRTRPPVLTWASMRPARTR